MFIIAAIVWIILVFVLAYFAEEKGRSSGAFVVIGLLLSPLIGFIILLVMGENKEALQKQNISRGVSKKCPFCANEIKKEAIVCQYCGKDLPIEKNDAFTEGQIYNVKQKIKLYSEQDYYDEILEILNPGDKVAFIATGHIVSIANQNAPMANVKTQNGLTGWCFSGFLEKI